MMSDTHYDRPCEYDKTRDNARFPPQLPRSVTSRSLDKYGPHGHVAQQEKLSAESERAKWTWNDAAGGWIKFAPSCGASLVVSGSNDAPSPERCAHAELLVSIVEHLFEHFSNYLEGTSIDVHVGDRIHTVIHPQKPDISFVEIRVVNPIHPKRAHVLFVTDYPDPYYLYDAELDNQQMVNIIGGMW